MERAERPSTARIEKEIADLERRLDGLYHNLDMLRLFSGTATRASEPYITLSRGVRKALEAAYRKQASIEAKGGE